MLGVCKAMVSVIQVILYDFREGNQTDRQIEKKKKYGSTAVCERKVTVDG